MNEVVFRETIRRHLKNAGFWLAVLGLCIIAAITGGSNGPARIWLGFATLAGLVFGSRLIGPEFSSGTLQLILAKPVNRSAYLLSRFAGVVVCLSIAVAAPLLVDVIGRAVVAHDPATEWRAVFAAALNQMLALTLLCALLAFLGSFTRSFANVGIYILTELAVGLVLGALHLARQSTGQFALFLQQHPIFIQTLTRINRELFPTAPDSLQLGFAALAVSNTAVALLLACLIFRRREVPYGAD